MAGGSRIGTLETVDLPIPRRSGGPSPDCPSGQAECFLSSSSSSTSSALTSSVLQCVKPPDRYYPLVTITGQSPHCERNPHVSFAGCFRRIKRGSGTALVRLLNRTFAGRRAKTARRGVSTRLASLTEFVGNMKKVELTNSRRCRTA